MQLRYLAALLSILLASCTTRDEGEAPQPGARPAGQVAEPSPEQGLEDLRAHIGQLEEQPEHSDPRVKVQHILIGYAGSVRGKPITRTKAEAEQLTAEIWARVQAGEGFDALVKEYTDDAHPGIYTMKSDPARFSRVSSTAWEWSRPSATSGGA
jgi:hypothetical protein